MGATLTLGTVTTTSISVSFSFTAQSPQITKVSCFCEEYNPTGTVYNARQFTFSARDSYSNSITWSGLATGRQHKLYVRSYSSSGATVQTTNILYPSTNSSTPSTPSDDHGNSMSSATTISVSSSGTGSASGSIETGGDEDYFKFTVPSGKGGTYHIYTSSSMDTKGYLYNSSGTQLAYNDDNSSMGGGNNFGIAYDLTASTTYYVKVTGYSSTTTGSYTLYIAKQASPDDHGNSFSTATSITIGSTAGTRVHSGTIGESGDLDYFKFTTIVGGTYKFYTTGSLDTKGWLYDSSQTQLNYNDDNSSMGGSTNFGFEHSLAANTTYYIAVGAYSSNTGDYTLNIVVPASVPSSMGMLTVGTLTPTSIQIKWSSVTGATNYCLEVYNAGTSTIVFSDYAISSGATSYTITGLTAGTSYDIKMYPKNSAGNGTPAYLYAQPTPSGLPASPTNFRVTVPALTNGFHLLWDAVTDATGYSVEAYHASTGSVVYSNYNFSGTSHQVTGLNEYVTYNLKLWAVNQYGNSSPVWLYNQVTKDGTAPIINFNNTDGAGKVYASWSATDAHSGIRETSKFAVYIGTANGESSSMVFKEYTDNYYYSFISDANGNAFVSGAKYWIKVYAYDAEGNSGMTSAQITYTRARPTSWTWHTDKVAGQPISLTAVEWNSFCTRINQFRQYKALSNYTFTEVSSGQTITAVVMNQAVSAINAMLASSNQIATVAQGQEIKASFFTGLSSKLNSL